MTQPQYPPSPYRPPGLYPPPTPGTNGFAIASLVFGIIGGCFLSIIFGIVALVQIKKSGQQGRGMAVAGLVLGVVWIVLLGIVVAVSLNVGVARDANGTITRGGGIYTEDLRTGDCANGMKDGEVITLDAVPCDEPHTGEVIALLTLTDNSFPGDLVLTERAKVDCFDELEVVSPRAYDDEDYSIYWIQPSDETWADGDRTLVCMVTTDDARSGSVTD